MGKTKEVELTHLQFLSKPENFKIAVEVFEHFEEVRTDLQEKYWSAVRHFVENHKSRREFGKWEVTYEDAEVPTDEYYGIAFDPRKQNSSLCCRVKLQQGRLKESFPISFGVAWNKETQPAKEPDVPELRTLRKHLREEHGMSGPAYNWWIARGMASYKLHDAEVLTQLAQDKTIQQLQADEFVQFFLANRNMLERLNAKIATRRS